MATAIPEVGLKKAKEPPKECRPRTYCSRPPSHSYLGRRGADAITDAVAGAGHHATQSSVDGFHQRHTHRPSAAHSSAIRGSRTDGRPHAMRVVISGHQWPSVIISSTPRSSRLPLEAACPHTLAKEEGGLDTALLAQRGNRAHAASRSGREEEGEAACRSKRCEAGPAA